jgi:hypothetical protein
MSREEIDGEDGGEYTNMHRAFLQAFMARSVMTVDEVKPVLAGVMSANGSSFSSLPTPCTVSISFK